MKPFFTLFLTCMISLSLMGQQDIKELKKALSKGGFVRCGICSMEIEGVPCAEKVKDDLHGDIREERADTKEKPSGTKGTSKCVVCSKPAKHVVYIGKQY